MNVVIGSGGAGKYGLAPAQRARTVSPNAARRALP